MKTTYRTIRKSVWDSESHAHHVKTPCGFCKSLCIFVCECVYIYIRLCSYIFNNARVYDNNEQNTMATSVFALQRLLKWHCRHKVNIPRIIVSYPLRAGVLCGPKRRNIQVSLWNKRSFISSTKINNCEKRDP